jgi:hypothetical protein
MINLARLFAFTRAVEVERDYWRDEALRWQNYALMSRGMPAVAVASEPRVSRPAPPPRPSINSLRRKAQGLWRAEPSQSMEEAADEYAAKIREG